MSVKYIYNMNLRLLTNNEAVLISFLQKPQPEVAPQLSIFINDVHRSRKGTKYSVNSMRMDH